MLNGEELYLTVHQEYFLKQREKPKCLITNVMMNYTNTKLEHSSLSRELFETWLNSWQNIVSSFLIINVPPAHSACFSGKSQHHLGKP